MKEFLPYIILFCGVFIASSSQILLKKSAMINYPNKLKEYLNPYVIIGYGMIFLSMILSIIAYKMTDYKNGPLMETVGFVLVLLYGCLFFKEKLSLRKLLGCIFIICGIIIFYL